MSYEELKKAFSELLEKPSTVKEVKSTVGVTVERPKPTVERPKRKMKREIKKEEAPAIRITSDQLRTAYFVLFGKTTRKSNIEVAKEIVSRLREIFGI